MLPWLILPFMLAGQQPPSPQAEPPAAALARFKGKALDPARIRAEAKQAQGCREDTRPTFTGQFTGYKNGGYVSQGVPNGMPQDLSDAEVHTFPVPAIIYEPDKHKMSDQERAPRFVEPEARAVLAPFSLVPASLGPASGAPLTLPQLEGKVVVLHFFNPACMHAEMLPEIVRLQAMQSKFPFRVVPVAIGMEHPVALDQFRRMNAKAIPPEFQVFLLGGVTEGPRSVFPDFAISPTTYILDRHGRVAWRICGSIPGTLTDRINHILAEPPSPPPGPGAGPLSPASAPMKAE